MHELSEADRPNEGEVKSTFDDMSLRDLVALGIRHLDAADAAAKLGKEGEEEARLHQAAAGEINGVLSEKHKTMLGHQITLDMKTLQRKSRLE